jgi:hypothetical protein
LILWPISSQLPCAQDSKFSIRLPPFPRQTALSSEGGQQRRLSKGGTTMKSDICTFALSAVAAASQRPLITTEPNSSQPGFRFKTAQLFLLLGLIAPLHSFAAEPYCIAANGGYGATTTFGTTFVARNFSLPAASKCTPWTGYTETADTVILTTSGTACLSSDSTALTVSVSSADPEYVGSGNLVADYIFLKRGDSSKPFSGQDTGEFAGPAESVSCASSLLNLPAYHN